jgi:hypothetical protein
MSISSVSNGTNPYTQSLQSSPLSDAFKQSKQDFAALGSALQSGDLAGAQKAFAALQQDKSTISQARGGQGSDSDGSSSTVSQTAQSSQSGTSSVQDLMNQLKQALGSGDLQGAQQAFASLQQNMQASRGHGHHHHGGGSQSNTTSSTGTTSATATTGSTAQTSGISVTA